MRWSRIADGSAMYLSQFKNCLQCENNTQHMDLELKLDDVCIKDQVDSICFKFVGMTVLSYSIEIHHAKCKNWKINFG